MDLAALAHRFLPSPDQLQGQTGRAGTHGGRFKGLALDLAPCRQQNSQCFLNRERCIFIAHWTLKIMLSALLSSVPHCCKINLWFWVPRHFKVFISFFDSFEHLIHYPFVFEMLLYLPFLRLLSILRVRPPQCLRASLPHRRLPLTALLLIPSSALRASGFHCPPSALSRVPTRVQPSSPNGTS